MQQILDRVRDLDLFAVPVSLTYKGKTRFSTLCGGCLSFVIILTFVTYAVVSLYQEITSPVLTGNVQKTYFSWSDNEEFYNITTLDSTLAVRVDGYTRSIAETNELLRVVFNRFTPDGGLEFVPTVNCSEYFANQTDGDSSFFDDAFVPLS